VDTFAETFRRATGKVPFPYQERFAQTDALWDLVHAPTGAGKTATAVLGWLHRRRFASEDVRKATPRRLVYCLPMRTLVEQTAASARHWLNNLDLMAEVGVHKLLGGDADDDWALHPERDAVLIGTQDMLLSRALNRGYAQGRFRWPIDFGLLNNDCLWVFDELQLMGSGVSTSAQLAGLRESLRGFGPGCASVWMSATLDRKWLSTVDFRDRVEALRELRLSNAELTTGELGKRMKAAKVMHATGAVGEKNYGKAVADLVRGAHLAGALSLVVLNTVARAKAVFASLQKIKGLAADLMLIHSRFRPAEREVLNGRLTEEPGRHGRIVVGTQVVEAGVDISARVLFTELAPWPSLVQRFGRCHRYGELDEPGVVFWLNLPTEDAGSKGARDIALPYEPGELNEARRYLELLDGRDVSPKALDEFQPDGGPVLLPFEHTHVLRRRDLLELFDTAPDLGGNNIDVARFVRGDDPETDVSVFWREFEGDPNADEEKQRWPRREELCPVPVGQLRDFLKGGDAPAGYWRDHLADKWARIHWSEVRPGMVVLLPCAAGGYDWDEAGLAGLGWCGEQNKKPAPVPVRLSALGEGEEGVGRDAWSQGPPQTLLGHTEDVWNEMNDILRQLDLPAELTDALLHAARWHDLGKVHPVFQGSVRAANPSLSGAEQWAKSGGTKALRHKRKHFRHELASALVMFQRGDSFPATYLVAAHHGRVRLAIRSLPGEKQPENPAKLFALGIWQDDELPVARLGPETVSPLATLDLSSMQLGKGSWTDRALALLREWGPFRLAYLEALLRAADMRASNNPKTGVQGG
jgi:CRISPR-associated endonuclease/helicase Cas3